MSTLESRINFYIICNDLLLSHVDIVNPISQSPSFEHNILVVYHGIARPDRKTHDARPTKLLC